MIHPEFYTFVDDLRKFTKESMQWCVDESENAAKSVVQSINILMKDTERVSRLSHESVQAIETLETQLKAFISAPGGEITFVSLVSSLRKLLDNHGELRGIIDPIIQALQFQDRLRQNLENQQKMIPIWLEIREKVLQEGEITNELLSEFSTALGGATTMKEERDILRNHLPEEYLPKEKEDDGTVEDALFF